jgi:hypothetical protein
VPTSSKIAVKEIHRGVYSCWQVKQGLEGTYSLFTGIGLGLLEVLHSTEVPASTQTYLLI